MCVGQIDLESQELKKAMELIVMFDFHISACQILNLQIH